MFSSRWAYAGAADVHGWGHSRRDSVRSWSPVGSVRWEGTGDAVTVTIVSLLVASAAPHGDGDASNPKQSGVQRTQPELRRACGRALPSAARPGMGNASLKLAKMH